MESRDYFILRNEIVNTLKELLIKKIGHRHTTYIFIDSNKLSFFFTLHVLKVDL